MSGVTDCLTDLTEFRLNFHRNLVENLNMSVEFCCDDYYESILYCSSLIIIIIVIITVVQRRQRVDDFAAFEVRPCGCVNFY